MVTRIGQRRRHHLYIKEHMDALGISDERAANRIGVARETVYRWRTEPTRLNPDKLAQLAEALDIEPQDFYRIPGKPSLDAIVRDAPEEVRETAVDIVRRLVGKAS
jgi:transcriptional regulator with XRE-family HTH domain